MIDTERGHRRGGGRRGRHQTDAAGTDARQVDYHNLHHPFQPLGVWTDDRVAAVHEAALEVLETLGMKVLLPEARRIFGQAGARVDDASQMVWIGREIIAATLATAPRSFALRAGASHKDLTMELGRLTILTGAGAPHSADRERGRRPGSLRDYDELTRLTQTYDVFQMLNPVIEPQDLPTHTRHYDVTRVQMTLSNKVPFFFARGTPQTDDFLEMLRLARGISADQLRAQPWSYTIINTNSPRQLDLPMSQGLIDSARSGQLAVVTPFCLMGAMAPVTIAGAVLLSHVEALAGIALNQLARPGAPVLYGSFTSNVDMKSGAPAFGTPEHIKANLAVGQMARHIGLPWRSATGAAGAVNDAQAAHETQFGAWGAVLAGATMLVHGAGWIEGGLTVSYEKLITDLDAMQVFAELCAPVPVDDAALALDALREVQPGGHFFGAAHTMERFSTAFYQPVVSDWSNHGTWTERGAKTADERATAVWKQALADFTPPPVNADHIADMDQFIALRKSQGGAPPES